MPTNVAAEKKAVVRQRQPEDGALSDGISVRNDSHHTRDDKKEGSADNTNSPAKSKTRRGGRRRFRKKRGGNNLANAPTCSKSEISTSATGPEYQEKRTQKTTPNASPDASRTRRSDARENAAQTHSHNDPQRHKTNGKSHRSPPHEGADRSQHVHTPQRSAIYSAIDLGTNNCRLLIAKPTRHGFRVIDAFSRIVRLGEGVGKDNRLSQEAMDRTIDALKVCSEKLARRGVTCMRHVATEACRIADNSDEFIARVKRETGINLDVISAGEEARLAVLGCQSLIAPDKRNALVFDIGGGSTELIWVKVLPGRQTEIKGWVSVPWGVVNLTEAFTKPDKALKNKKYRKMVSAVEGHLQAFNDAHGLDKILKGRHTQFLGTSGTVTTLASLHLELPRYVRDKVDGAWMKAKDIKALSRKVAEMTPEERAAEPCIGVERADLVVAGCAILEAILGMWQVPSLRVADRGIREGILRGLMQLDQPQSTGHSGHYKRRNRKAGRSRNDQGIKSEENRG